MRHVDSRNMRKSSLAQSEDRSNSARWEMPRPEVLPGLELAEESSYPNLCRSQPQVRMWWEGGSAKGTLTFCISEGSHDHQCGPTYNHIPSCM